MSKKFHLDSVLLSHQAQNLLKSRTAALIADIGIKKASELCGVSTSTLKQYGGSRYEDFRRFMPINFVQLLEAESGLPCITSALAEVNGGQLVKRADFNQTDDPSLEAAFLKICSQCSTVISEAVRARAVSPLTKEQCADQLDRLSELEASLVSLKRFLAEVQLPPPLRTPRDQDQASNKASLELKATGQQLDGGGTTYNAFQAILAFAFRGKILN